MNFPVALFFAVSAALLVSCSGWKHTTNTSSTNVSVDTGPVKVKGNDDETKVSLFGKKVTVASKGKGEPPVNEKQFYNGEFCRYCDYIQRYENEHGNLEESEVRDGYKNGEEREYRDGLIIRSSYYVDGGKSGMEYFFSNGEKVDSVYTQTIHGTDMNKFSVLKALPPLAAKYIYDTYIGIEPLGVFYFTVSNDKITSIYRYGAKMSGDESAGYHIVGGLEYENHSSDSSFKFFVNSPVYETLEFKDGELNQRKIVRGPQTLYDFKKNEYLKTYYQDGKDKLVFTGNVSASLEEGSRECQGMCRLQSYHENGAREEEGFYMDGLLKEQIKWNKQNVIVRDLKMPKYIKEFYDDGTPKLLGQGEMVADKKDIRCVNGQMKSFHPNGNVKREEVRENGNMVRVTEWNEQGTLVLEAQPHSYYKKYYADGQQQSLFEGEWQYDSDTLAFHDGVRKEWYADGKPFYEKTFKNGEIVAQKDWEPGEFLKYDYEINKHVKRFPRDSLAESSEYTGEVVARDGAAYCVGNCEIKKHQGKVLRYHETKEGYDSTLAKYRKVTVAQFDSAGNKKDETRFNLDTIVSYKKWNPGGVLILEFDPHSAYKTYYDNKKPRMNFVGKSRYENRRIDFIDGVVTYFYENGKKSSESGIENQKIVRKKEWNDKGALLVDFVADKQVVVYYPDTKKVKSRFEGKVSPKGNDFLMIDGVVQYFDESGKLMKKESYVNGVPQPESP